MSNLIDLDDAIENLGLDKEDFLELANDLKEFTDETIPKLKIAIESNNLDDLNHLAHAVKGALLNLRFKTAGNIALQLERIGKGDSSENPAPLLSDFIEKMEKSYDYLKTL